MIVIRPAPEGTWTNDDIQWFRDNPEKRWRVRDPVPGEMESLAEYGDSYQKDSIRSLNEAALNLEIEQNTFRMIVFQIRPGQRYRVPLLGPRKDTDEIVFVDPVTGEGFPPDTLYEQLKSFFFSENTICTRCDRDLSTGDLVFITRRDGDRFSCVTCARCVVDDEQNLELLSAAVHIEPKYEKIPRHKWPRHLRDLYEKNEQIIKGIYQS